MFTASYWDPFSSFGFRELSRALADSSSRPRRPAPHVDYRENQDGYTFTFEVPGLAEQDLEIEVHHQVLTVRAERKPETPEGFTAHRLERPTFRLAQSYTLPSRVDVEKVQAKLEDGVLTVTLPKAVESRPRRIEVKTAEEVQVQS